MILILYNQFDKSSLSFINYLQEHGYKNYISLETRELLNNTTIQDDFKQSCIWEVSNQKINFVDITGIYNRIFELNTQYFDEYKEEDRGYVAKEWWCYLIYMLNINKNCINPITPEFFSGKLLQFPYLLRKAKEVGLNTPEFYLSTDYNFLKEKFFSNNNKKYTVVNSLSSVTHFKKSNSIEYHNIGLIEFIKGSLLFVHVIGDNVFCTRQVQNIKTETLVEQSELDKYIHLIKNLNLKIGQIILIEDAQKNRFVFHVSAYPNWNHAYSALHKNIFDSLYKLLSSEQNRP